jgi:hypothetical protein
MTRRAYNRCVEPRLAEVRRVLERYLVEIVEAYELCPWARAARLAGEIAIDVVWGAPGLHDWVTAAERALARSTVRVAMVIAPELPIARDELRGLRDRVAARVPAAGVAEFHPDAPLDLATPARLVPFVRRSPDPMLQLVPLAILDTARAPPHVADRARQAAALGGRATPPPPAVADRIAAANHARVVRDVAAITARLDDIAADRTQSYARVGIARR